MTNREKLLLGLLAGAATDAPIFVHSPQIPITILGRAVSVQIDVADVKQL